MKQTNNDNHNSSCFKKERQSSPAVPLRGASWKENLAPASIITTMTEALPLAGGRAKGEGISETRVLIRRCSEDASSHPHHLSSQAPTHILLWKVCRLAAPVSISQVGKFSIMFTMLAAAGRLGVAELGGASVALSLLNATAFAVGSGMCGALETLLAQSFGRNPMSKAYGIYAQRMCCLLVMSSIPVMLLLSHTEAILMWIGESSSAAAFAGKFCRASLFSVFPVMLLELLTRYYVSQQLPGAIFLSLFIGALVSPFALWAGAFLWGYKGIGIVWTILTVVMDAGLVLYLCTSGLYHHTWGGWSREALRQWWPLLRLAIPSVVMACSQWTAMETNAVVAGFGTPTELAAYAISSQVASICWAAASGIFTATTVLVGTQIGRGRSREAKRYAILTSFMALVMGTVDSIVLYVLRYRICSLFTDDKDVMDAFARLVPFVITHHIVDTIQCNFLAILRACGMYVISMAIIFVSLSLVGIPLGVWYFLRRNGGIEALWYGPTLGLFVVMTPTFWLIFTNYLHWEEFSWTADDSAAPGKDLTSLDMVLNVKGASGKAV